MNPETQNITEILIRLKPCPFCGSTKLCITNSYHFLIACENCGGIFSVRSSKQKHPNQPEETINVWNKRNKGDLK